MAKGKQQLKATSSCSQIAKAPEPVLAQVGVNAVRSSRAQQVEAEEKKQGKAPGSSNKWALAAVAVGTVAVGTVAVAGVPALLFAGGSCGHNGARCHYYYYRY